MHLVKQAKSNGSALELKRHLCISCPTARLRKHKVIGVMCCAELQRQLTECIEIDDAYLYGEVQGTKSSCGPRNKIPPMAAVQTTESGQPVLMCLSTPRPFSKESIQVFA